MSLVNNSIYLFREFVENSDEFYEDLEQNSQGIDSKHSKIIQAAYADLPSLSQKKKKIAEDVDWDFRSWSGQDDLNVPPQFRQLTPEFSIRYCKDLLKTAYQKCIHARDNERKKQEILDDIAILDESGYSDLVSKNPVDVTPGVREYYFVNGLSVSLRWLRYIYFFGRMKDFDLVKDGQIWVDIGPYYGGLQGIVKKYQPNARLILIDFHHQLARSYVYLKTLFPDATHLFPNQIRHLKSFEDLPSGAIAYYPALEFDRISNFKADTVTNFFSFGEMKRSTFQSYFNSDLIRGAKMLYMVNRFVSAPRFEPTYDTDLTMLDFFRSDHEIKFFDIFPMHHNMVMPRELFGRVRPRPISSPYFEILFQSR